MDGPLGKQPILTYPDDLGFHLETNGYNKKQKDTPRYYKTAAPQGFGRGKNSLLIH